MLSSFLNALLLVTVTCTAVLAVARVTAQADKVDVPGIENFSQLGRTTGSGGTMVGFGGATAPSAMVRLRNEGFATVLNLRLETEDGADVDAGRAAAKAAGLQYMHLPFDTEHPDPRRVDNFLSAVGDEENQPVYIHCHSATRVAALWMIKRVLEDGWTMDRARMEAETIAERPPDAIAFAEGYLGPRTK